eukprot:2859406-Prymnesium_polylepis.3
MAIARHPVGVALRQIYHRKNKGGTKQAQNAIPDADRFKERILAPGFLFRRITTSNAARDRTLVLIEIVFRQAPGSWHPR